MRAEIGIWFDIFIQGNAESQSDLPGNSRAAPWGIPPFGVHNGINKLFRRSLGTGLSSALL
jgi:hypothetical protein